MIYTFNLTSFFNIKQDQDRISFSTFYYIHMINNVIDRVIKGIFRMDSLQCRIQRNQGDITWDVFEPGAAHISRHLWCGETFKARGGTIDTINSLQEKCIVIMLNFYDKSRCLHFCRDNDLGRNLDVRTLDIPASCLVMLPESVCCIIHLCSPSSPGSFRIDFLSVPSL